MMIERNPCNAALDHIDWDSIYDELAAYYENPTLENVSSVIAAEIVMNIETGLHEDVTGYPEYQQWLTALAKEYLAN